MGATKMDFLKKMNTFRKPWVARNLAQTLLILKESFPVPLKTFWFRRKGTQTTDLKIFKPILVEVTK